MRLHGHAAEVDPWGIELIVVRHGSHGGGERRELTRDVERHRLVRLRQGVYAPHAAVDGLTPEQRHVLAIRALVAVCAQPPVLSHWSAAVLLGLPAYRHGLQRVHVTSEDGFGRGRDGVADHALGLADRAVMELRGLQVTTAARTAVDIAALRPPGEGIAVADGALHRGVPRAELERELDQIGVRRGSRRAAEAIAFAHAGAEGANESESRWTMYRLGLEPPELQREFWDEQGYIVATDTYDRRSRVAGEADGAKKYLDPALATEGAGRAVYEEKRKEDRLRRQVAGLARWGWTESRSTALLGPILFRAGIRPAERRPTLGDWAAEARYGMPRRRRFR